MEVHDDKNAKAMANSIKFLEDQKKLAVADLTSGEFSDI
jgi:hypothetical protein